MFLSMIYIGKNNIYTSAYIRAAQNMNISVKNENWYIGMHKKMFVH
jgi:hypothetical protein